MKMRRLIKFLLVPAAFIRGRCLFEGVVYSSNYGIYACITDALTSPSFQISGISCWGGGGGGVRAHPNCVQHPLPPEKLCYSIVIYIEKIDFRAHEILFKALLPSPEY